MHRFLTDEEPHMDSNIIVQMTCLLMLMKDQIDVIMLEHVSPATSTVLVK